VGERKAGQDLVVVGSASVAHTLMEHDLVDEYRLLVFPLVIGANARSVVEGGCYLAAVTLWMMIA
jgi:dihydrofolate reductase